MLWKGLKYILFSSRFYLKNKTVITKKTTRYQNQFINIFWRNPFRRSSGRLISLSLSFRKIQFQHNISIYLYVVDILHCLASKKQFYYILTLLALGRPDFKVTVYDKTNYRAKKWINWVCVKVFDHNWYFQKLSTLRSNY